MKTKGIRQFFAPVSATTTATMRNDKTEKENIDSVIQIDWNKLDNEKKKIFAFRIPRKFIPVKYIKSPYPRRFIPANYLKIVSPRKFIPAKYENFAVGLNCETFFPRKFLHLK